MNQLHLDASAQRARLLLGLNPEQARVVEHDTGPAVVAAVPGAGKTTALVRRIAYLARVRGVDPTRILCTTFAKKAAVEMTTRAAALLGEKSAQVSTFHSFCNRVLRDEMPGYSKWELDENGSAYHTMIKKVLGHEHMKWDRGDPNAVAGFIGLAKADGLHPTDEGIDALARLCTRRSRGKIDSHEHLLDAYMRVEAMRQNAFLLTFDDWLVEARDALRADENARRRWAALYDYVQVDEVQDTSKVQFDLIDLLCRDHRNLVAVGDAQQSLFGFRGSRPELFRNFAKAWSAPVIEMQRNYRSGTAIIAHAGDVFDEIPADIRSGPRLVAEMEHVGSVTVRSAATFETEAGDLAEELIALHADGMAWRDVAVIYRTNARSRAFEEAFTAAKIPYRVSGGAFFYARREVATLVAYLRVAWRKGATMDDMRKSLFAPNRYLGKAYFAALEAVVDAHKKNPGATPVSIRELAERACQGMGRVTGSQRSSAATWGALLDGLRADVAAGGKQARPSVMIQRVLDATGFIAWLKKDEGSDSPENDRTANVAELIRAASSFATVGDLLDHVAVQQAAFKGAREDLSAPAADAVLLSSIHGVKGLEFPRVYLVACCANILPHFFADDIEEERRLYYVAVTRAKDALTVSYARADVTGENMRPMYPSQFLDGLIASQGHADDGDAPESMTPEEQDDFEENADDEGELFEDDGDSGVDPDDSAGGEHIAHKVARVIPLFGKKPGGTR